MNKDNQAIDFLKLAEEAEQAAIRNFEYHIGIALELSKIIHRWGDDDFGYIRQLFDEALAQHKSSKPTSRDLAMFVSSSNPTRAALSKSVKMQVLKDDGFKCVSCKSEHDLCVDHKHPVSRGGNNNRDNLQTLCRSCNSKKGTKTMAEWLEVK